MINMYAIEPIQLITLLGFGFMLGLRHAFDADHVIAVSTLVGQTKSLKKSSLLGITWGLGHTTSLLLAGLLILGLKIAIPDKITLSFEFIVGIILIALGVDVLRKITKEKIHLHMHKHGNITHAHFHTHKHSKSHNNTHKSFFVGSVHGIAGSAVLPLVVLTTVNSLFAGLLFILIFGVGSILGMLMVSTIIGLSFILTKKFDKICKSIKIVSGAISIVLGLIIMYKIGFVNKLFM